MHLRKQRSTSTRSSPAATPPRARRARELFIGGRMPLDVKKIVKRTVKKTVKIIVKRTVKRTVKKTVKNGVE